MKASPKRFLQFSLLASQNPVCASSTNDPFFIDRSFRLVGMKRVANTKLRVTTRDKEKTSGYIDSSSTRPSCVGTQCIASLPFHSVEPDVLRRVLRVCEEQHLIIEANLPPVVGRCLNLEIIDAVLTWLVAQGVANLVHVEFEHTIRIDADDRWEPGDLDTRLLTHDICDNIPFDASTHGHATPV